MELVQRNFFMLTRLKYLDLSGNPLQDLQPDVFRDVPVSTRIALWNLYNTNNLRTSYLYLAADSSPSLSIVCTLQELKVLKCRNCQLKKINPQLYNLLPLLSELDLGRNEVCVATKPIHAPDIFQLFLVLAPFFFLQFKFLDKDEFRDVKRLTKVLLDGNQLSVVVDQLFRMQKSLNHLGELLKLPTDGFLFPSL